MPGIRSAGRTSNHGAPAARRLLTRRAGVEAEAGVRPSGQNELVGRNAWPISLEGSAPGFGLNFCGRPTCTSAV